jgi:DNA-binding CsgD family transcriptional regulator
VLRQPGLTVMRGWLAAARGDLVAATAALAPVVEGATRSCTYWPLWPCWMGLFHEIGTAAADQAFTQTVVDVAELAADRNPTVASFEGLALNVRARSNGDLGLLRQSADVLARRAKWSAATGRPEASPDSLTEAERRVALLIASGHTNRSAATELGLSVNTIGTHLRSAFAKLGVQSRVQLANALRHELPVPRLVTTAAAVSLPHLNR